jgi:hypothetical protein
MPRPDNSYSNPSDAPPSALRKDGIEYGFIGKLQGLKYEYRTDITKRAKLEKNFREKFEALNRVRITGSEFNTDRMRSSRWTSSPPPRPSAESTAQSASTTATASSDTPPTAARLSPPSRLPRCSKKTTAVSSWWTAKTSTASSARSSTDSRKAASRKTPISLTSSNLENR